MGCNDDHEKWGRRRKPLGQARPLGKPHFSSWVAQFFSLLFLSLTSFFIFPSFSLFVNLFLSYILFPFLFLSSFSVSSCLLFHFLLSFLPPNPYLHFATNMYQVSILCPTLWRALKKEQHLQWPIGALRAQGRSKKEATAIQFQVVRWGHLTGHLIQTATQKSDV